MRLLPCGTPIKGEKRRIFRHGLFGELMMTGLLVVVPLVVLWHQRSALLGISGVKALFVAPVALVAFLLWFLIASASLHSFRSALLSSNWIMTVTSNGVFLNLRSYRNAHFGGEDATVLHLAFSEIKSAGSLQEKSFSKVGNKQRTTFRRYLELTLASSDTEAVSEAIHAEMERKAPPSKFLGITSKTKFHHVPVIVPRPGVIQVEWTRGMLYALEGRARVVDARRVDLSTDHNDGGLNERVDLHLVRGNRMEALSLVREELSLGHREAKDWIEEHRGRRAS